MDSTYGRDTQLEDFGGFLAQISQIMNRRLVISPIQQTETNSWLEAGY